MKTSKSRRGLHSAFTLVELLVCITIVIVLAAFVLGMTRRGLNSARTSKSISNLHQIHTGIMAFAAENGMRIPVGYAANLSGQSAKPPKEVEATWYQAAGRQIYASMVEKTPIGTWIWGATDTKTASAYDGTVFRSPNAEPGYNKGVASYGYNFNIQRKLSEDGKSVAAATADPAIYQAGRTGLVADNSGKTHTLSPGAEGSSGALNARNGASAPYKSDGRVAVVYLDGHADTLTAQQAKAINADKKHAFWGVEE